MSAIDVTITMWHPLPAPPDRYVLARYRDKDFGFGSCQVATDHQGGLLAEDGSPLPKLEDFDAWAYLPYDNE